MPDQNQTDPNIAPAPSEPMITPPPTVADQPVTPPTEENVTPAFMATDSPPPPPIIEENNPTNEEMEKKDDAEEKITPPSDMPKKKPKGLVAGIVAALLLVAGLGAGVVLVRQQQDIREKAANCSTVPVSACATINCPSGCKKYTEAPGICSCVADSTPTATKTPTPTPTTTRVPTPPTVTTTATSTPKPPTSTPKPTSTLCPKSCVASPKSNCKPGSFYPSEAKSLAYGDCGGTGSNEYCCDPASPTATATPKPSTTAKPTTALCPKSCVASPKSNCKPGSFYPSEAKSLAYGDCGGEGFNEYCCDPIGEPTATVTTTSTPKPPSGQYCQCLNVVAYDANWNALDAAKLKLLKAGDVVRFTVKGRASSGKFDKAKFKINGQETAEVTVKKPSSEEFYYEYTIPANVYTFTIDAKIHHDSKGWSN